MRLVSLVPILFFHVCADALIAGQDRPFFTRADGVVLSAPQIDRSVKRLMQAGSVPGLALALIERGAVSYVKPYGMADMLGAQVRITARHQFPTQFPADTDANEDIRLTLGMGGVRSLQSFLKGDQRFLG